MQIFNIMKGYKQVPILYDYECQSIKKGGKHSLKVYKDLEGTVNFLSPSFIISSNGSSPMCAGKLFHNGIVLA